MTVLLAGEPVSYYRKKAGPPLQTNRQATQRKKRYLTPYLIRLVLEGCAQVASPLGGNEPAQLEGVDCEKRTFETADAKLAGDALKRIT